jgi:uncharacterized protein YndB with AHSA1/START domain
MEIRAKKYQLEIVIDAPREAVWRALVDETDAWWLPDFHMLGEGSVVTFDATAGGQLIERKEDGGSLLWYTVSMCTPGESLHLVGHMAPAFGGPSTTMLHLALTERDGATVLSVEDALFGHVTDASVSSLEAGWAQLFGDGLKRHVER